MTDETIETLKRMIATYPDSDSETRKEELFFTIEAAKALLPHTTDGRSCLAIAASFIVCAERIGIDR